FLLLCQLVGRSFTGSTLVSTPLRGRFFLLLGGYMRSAINTALFILFLLLAFLTSVASYLLMSHCVQLVSKQALKLGRGRSTVTVLIFAFALVVILLSLLFVPILLMLVHLTLFPRALCAINPTV
ncbi:hypothetical protein EA831_20290, partial [Vibrio anguillarum]|nr:hypothetical protein [Vibrio anguillarum]